MVGRQVPQARQIANSQFGLTTLDQVSRGLVLQEGQAEDQASEDDVETGGNLPPVVGVVAKVDFTSVVRKVSQDDTWVTSA